MILGTTIRVILAQVTADLLVSLAGSAVAFFSGWVQSLTGRWTSHEQDRWTNRTTGGEWVPWSNSQRVPGYNGYTGYGNNGYRTAPVRQRTPEYREPVIHAVEKPVPQPDVAPPREAYGVHAAGLVMAEDIAEAERLGDIDLMVDEHTRHEMLVEQLEDAAADYEANGETLTNEEIEQMMDELEEANYESLTPIVDAPSKMVLTPEQTAAVEAFGFADGEIMPGLYRQMGLLYRDRGPYRAEIGDGPERERIAEQMEALQTSILVSLNQKVPIEHVQATCIDPYNILGHKIGEMEIGY